MIVVLRCMNYLNFEVYYINNIKKFNGDFIINVLIRYFNYFDIKRNIIYFLVVK